MDVLGDLRNRLHHQIDQCFDTTLDPSSSPVTRNNESSKAEARTRRLKVQNAELRAKLERAARRSVSHAEGALSPLPLEPCAASPLSEDALTPEVDRLVAAHPALATFLDQKARDYARLKDAHLQLLQRLRQMQTLLSSRHETSASPSRNAVITASGPQLTKHRETSSPRDPPAVTVKEEPASCPKSILQPAPLPSVPLAAGTATRNSTSKDQTTAPLAILKTEHHSQLWTEPESLDLEPSNLPLFLIPDTTLRPNHMRSAQGLGPGRQRASPIALSHVGEQPPSSQDMLLEDEPLRQSRERPPLTTKSPAALNQMRSAPAMASKKSPRQREGRAGSRARADQDAETGFYSRLKEEVNKIGYPTNAPGDDGASFGRSGTNGHVSGSTRGKRPAGCGEHDRSRSGVDHGLRRPSKRTRAASPPGFWRTDMPGLPESSAEQ